jgi:ketosteroid isomerase-like protein
MASRENGNQIRELIENWAKAVRNRNPSGILAVHSEDFVMCDVPEPFQSIGLDAYRHTWENFIKYTMRKCNVRIKPIIPNIYRWILD